VGREYPRAYRRISAWGKCIYNAGSQKAEEGIVRDAHDQDSITPYGNLADALLDLQRLTKRGQIIQQAHVAQRMIS